MILNQLIELLSPLKFYNLKENSQIYKELSAYSKSFDFLDEQLNQLEKEAFIVTAENEGLSVYEQFIGLSGRPKNDFAKRREIILYRSAITPNDFTVEGIANSIRCAGVNADIVENFNNTITIIVKGFIGQFDSYDEVVKFVSSMIPAHIEAIFDIGNMTWEAFDNRDLTFSQIDELGQTWEQFDMQVI